jgi:hypothetical protein
VRPDTARVLESRDALNSAPGSLARGTSRAGALPVCLAWGASRVIEI